MRVCLMSNSQHSSAWGKEWPYGGEPGTLGLAASLLALRATEAASSPQCAASAVEASSPVLTPLVSLVLALLVVALLLVVSLLHLFTARQAPNAAN